ncbi:hypothetical protein AGMMS50229_00270 [Campylobacterota bacterium]|nr:hypothetical protein AGMMS50229_00270 [Campylobacterota bacterium]
MQLPNWLKREPHAITKQQPKIAVGRFGAGSIESCKRTIASIRGDWNKQSQDADVLKAAMVKNGKRANEVSDTCFSLAKVANKVKTELQNAHSVCESSLAQMNEIKATTEATTGSVISLNNKTTTIGNIVRSINAITNQTKVIAFNAALEAASAGEHGKRFAVVASEINRLTDDIAGLTRQIKDQIAAIGESAGELIVASEEGSDRVMHGDKLLKKLLSIFAQIQMNTEIITSQSEEMGEKSKRAADTNNEVVKKLETVVGDYGLRSHLLDELEAETNKLAVELNGDR